MFDLTKPWPPGLNRETCFLFVLSLVVAVLVVSQIDIWASRDAIGWPGWARAPFFWITDYGLSDWLLIPSCGIFAAAVFAGHFLRGFRRVACYEVSMLAGYIFIGVGLPGLAANLIKRLVGRGRPDMFDQFGAFSFHGVFNGWELQSFPSGHATTAVGIAFVVGFLSPRLFGWLLAIGILIALSRIIVGAHYPSDVFAGACLGLIGSYAVRNFFARRGWMFKTRCDGCIVPRPMAAIRRFYRRARA